MNPHSTTVKTPGKLIISGEHSVVYGAPAIVFAINQHITATVSTSDNDFHFSFPRFELHNYLSTQELKQTKINIDNAHEHRLNTQDPSPIITSADQYIYYIVSSIYSNFNLPLTNSLNISLDSTIPVGCGLGSSAALAVALIKAITKHFEINITNQQIFDLALQIEHIQHYKSSGIDIYPCIYGGAILLQDGQIKNLHFDHDFIFVQTGKPQSSTCECVAHVNTHFASDNIWQAFTDITLDIYNNLVKQKNIRQSLKANHQLLNTIGVVPRHIQQFIQDIENIDGAAKICGAGAVSGNSAGIVMASCDNKQAVLDLCRQYNYSILKLSQEQASVNSH